MDRFQSVLLEVWREAGRHIEIRESAQNFAQLLGEHLPLAFLVVRRLDAGHHSLETIAIGSAQGGLIPPLSKTILPAAKLRRLNAWGREGTVLHGAAGVRSADLAVLVPADFDVEVLVGPLQGPERLAGALLLVAGENKSFRTAHVQMMEALLEPLSAALENDRRLAELAGNAAGLARPRAALDIAAEICCLIQIDDLVQIKSEESA